MIGLCDLTQPASRCRRRRANEETGPPATAAAATKATLDAIDAIGIDIRG
jgi:hypothetical protein